MDPFDPDQKELKSKNLDDLDRLDKDVSDRSRDEEFAAELTALDEETIINRDDQYEGEDQMNTVPGWIALGLAILSLFMMPIIIGGAAIIIGFIARNRGSLWLGNIAIGVGVISIIIRLFFIPFV